MSHPQDARRDADRPQGAEPAGVPGPPPHQMLRTFQRHIETMYGDRDKARGIEGTYMWFAEEVGELARAIRRGDPENLLEEFGDALAWLTTLASLSGVELEDAAARYSPGCPRCSGIPCSCARGPGRS